MTILPAWTSFGDGDEMEEAMEPQDHSVSASDVEEAMKHLVKHLDWRMFNVLSEHMTDAERTLCLNALGDDEECPTTGIQQS